MRKYYYRDVRPIVLPDTLEELTSTITGPQKLPRSIYWGTLKSFDLSDPLEQAMFYENVVSECLDKTQFKNYLNKETLVAIWPKLRIPGITRIVWENDFPILRTNIRY